MGSGPQGPDLRGQKVNIGVRGFPLWANLMPECNGTRAWTPWEILPPPSPSPPPPWEGGRDLQKNTIVLSTTFNIEILRKKQEKNRLSASATSKKQ